MRTITLTDFKRMGVETMKEYLPLAITVEGEIVLTVDTVDNVIGLSDLHPYVRRMLKNMELKARAGMPQVEQVYTRKPAHTR